MKSIFKCRPQYRVIAILLYLWSFYLIEYMGYAIGGLIGVSISSILLLYLIIMLSITKVELYDDYIFFSMARKKTVIKIIMEKNPNIKGTEEINLILNEKSTKTDIKERTSWILCFLFALVFVILLTIIKK